MNNENNGKKFLPFKRKYILYILGKKYTFGEGCTISFCTNLLQLPVWCKQEVGKKKQNAKMKCSNLVLFKTQTQVIDTIIEVSVWY